MIGNPREIYKKNHYGLDAFNDGCATANYVRWLEIFFKKFCELDEERANEIELLKARLNDVNTQFQEFKNR